MAFTEKTNGEMGIACSSERTCWVACECQSDWSTSAPSGEYVYAKDDRYANGLSSMSANGSLSSMSASGNLSTMSGSYSISTMGSNGGMTCYKKACPNGGYLDKPNSTYFKSSQKGGTLGLTCYNATSCASGYSENGAGASYSYHSDITCKKCTYSCPSGYSFTTKSSDCSSSQTFKTTSATTQSGCTPNNECGKCESSKPEYYRVRVVLGATERDNGSSIYMYTHTYKTANCGLNSGGLTLRCGVVLMGFSCKNGINNGSSPLFSTITVKGEIEDRAGTSETFSADIDCSEYRSTINNKTGHNGTLPVVISKSPISSSELEGYAKSIHTSEFEANIPGVGNILSGEIFEYNGKRYQLLFDITKEWDFIDGIAGDWNGPWWCDEYGDDTEWPNCD